MFATRIRRLLAPVALALIALAAMPGYGVEERPVPAAGRPAAAAAVALAVLYPDIEEPFRAVFTRIIEGIRDRARGNVASFPVGANYNGANLATELKRQNVQVVIALGRHGVRAASGLDKDTAVVVGGVLAIPENELKGAPVFSLAPDPALLFERLKMMMPAARRVIVAYDPRQNGWLMRLARDAARAQNIELVAGETADLKSAMRFYQEQIAAADPRRDAIWLPQDSVTVEDTATLPFVLQEAWDRSLAVFSSSVSHVRRGALFALYPDNLELGRSLATSAATAHGNGRIMPLRDTLMAVNLRTAGHLGLNATPRPGTRFDMVFPEP